MLHAIVYCSYEINMEVDLPSFPLVIRPFWDIVSHPLTRMEHQNWKGLEMRYFWVEAESVSEIMCFLCIFYFRVQLGECLKTVIHADYPELWPALLPSIFNNLKSANQQRVFGALYALRILTRKYEYVSPCDPIHSWNRLVTGVI